MQWSTSGKNFIREHAVSYSALRTLTQYRHLVIIDAFLCPWGESPYIFSNLNLLADTPVNPDNRHLFLAPINLTNANTSLSTFFCNRSCLSECKIILEFTTFQCSQCYNTPDRMICSCQFETIYFGILQVMQRMVWIKKYIDEGFLSASVDYII